MSNRALTAAFQHSRSKGSARLVLLAMADEANDQGLLTAYRRSQSWLGSKANVDKGTVRRAIDALEALGEVLVLGQGDGRASSDYQLVLPDLAPIEGVQAAPPAPADGPPRGGDLHPEGVQAAPPIIPLLPDPAPDGPVPPREPDAFDAFWQLYPRKLGKPEARKAWDAMVVKAKVAVAEVLDGLDPWLVYWAARAQPEFTPHPSTWLRRQQWADQPPPPGNGKPAGPGPRAPIMENRDTASGQVTDL